MHWRSLLRDNRHSLSDLNRPANRTGISDKACFPTHLRLNFPANSLVGRQRGYLLVIAYSEMHAIWPTLTVSKFQKDGARHVGAGCRMLHHRARHLMPFSLILSTAW